MDDKNEPNDVVNIFDTKYRSTLNDPLCESLESLSFWVRVATYVDETVEAI